MDTLDILKNICRTCLSRNRKLFHLSRVGDDVNILFVLLSYDIEAYRQGFFKDTASVYICWECKAIMRKICSFKHNACMAQKILAALTDGQTDKKLEKESLSALSIKNTSEYRTIVSDTSELADGDNFIDCGSVEVKLEKDIDDLPLSVLQSYNDTCKVEETDTNSLDVEDINTEYNNEEDNDRSTKNSNPVTCSGKYLSKIPMNETETDKFETGQTTTACENSAEKSEANVERAEDSVDSKRQRARKKTKKTTFKTKEAVLKPRKKRFISERKTPLGYKCAHCEKYFETNNLRYRHIRRFHFEGFTCTCCGKRFPYKDNLIKHERIHQGPMPREKCEICGKMIRVDLMKAHSLIHAERETYTCVECDKKYSSRASYENHLKCSKVHAGVDVLKFKCLMCDKGYRSKGELRDHMNYQHLDKTKHKCPICGKALATRRCITRHVRRIHQDIKENARDKICQQCGKAFRDKKGLREHEFIHTGERPLSCEICGCTFRQSASLYTHKKRVHNIYPSKKNVQLLED